MQIILYMKNETHKLYNLAFYCINSKFNKHCHYDYMIANILWKFRCCKFIMLPTVDEYYVKLSY